MPAGKHIRRATADLDGQVPDTQSHDTSAALDTPTLDDENERRTSRARLVVGGGLSRFGAVGHYIRRRDGRKRTHALRRVLTAIVAALVVAVGAGIAYLHRVDATLSYGIDSRMLDALVPQNGNDPFYLLVLGVDDNEEHPDDGYAAGGRADAILLVRLDTQSKAVALVSIPRTLVVDLDDLGEQELGVTYAVGGAPRTTQAVGELAGVTISHYVELGFEDLSTIIDQLGGIDITLPVSVSDPAYTGLDLAAGTVHLDGYNALMLARSRHAYDAYGPGEHYRAANQRAIVTAALNNLLGRNPLTFPGALAGIAQHITTDLDSVSALRLVAQMRGLDVSTNVYSAQIPTAGATGEAEWRERLDADAWNAMRARIESGDAPYAQTSDDPTLGIAGTAAPNKVNGDDGADVADMGIEPEYGGTVSVLNATDVQGLAADAAEKLNSAGFEAGADNAPGPSDTSRVVYNGDDALGKAMAVAETLGIADTPTANNGTLPTDANVVVVLGADAM